MRRPNVLDVVRAVTEVAPEHPEVRVWWYAPIIDAELPAGPGDDRPLEIVLELANTDRPDLEAIGSALCARLRWPRVTVREHRGQEEESRLFRMLTAG